MHFPCNSHEYIDNFEDGGNATKCGLLRNREICRNLTIIYYNTII